MTNHPHLILNSTRRAYIWPGPQQASLPSLSTAQGGPISQLLYLLGTVWNGDRLALVSNLMTRTDIADAAWEDLGDAKERGAIWHDDPILDDATEYAAEAGKRAFNQHDETHRDRAPRMVVNYDLRERLDPAELGDGVSLRRIACGSLGLPGGTQTALALLLAGSSRGKAENGDFPTNSDLVGTWAGCRIGVVPVNSTEVPRGTRSITDDVVSVLEAAHLGSYTVGAQGEVVRTEEFRRGQEKYLRKFRSRARYSVS